jgi:hypothetical protein
MTLNTLTTFIVMCATATFGLLLIAMAHPWY